MNVNSTSGLNNYNSNSLVHNLNAATKIKNSMRGTTTSSSSSQSNQPTTSAWTISSIAAKVLEHRTIIFSAPARTLNTTSTIVQSNATERNSTKRKNPETTSVVTNKTESQKSESLENKPLESKSQKSESHENKKVKDSAQKLTSKAENLAQAPENLNAVMKNENITHTSISNSIPERTTTPLATTSLDEEMLLETSSLSPESTYFFSDQNLDLLPSFESSDLYYDNKSLIDSIYQELMRDDLFSNSSTIQTESSFPYVYGSLTNSDEALDSFISSISPISPIDFPTQMND